MRHLDDLTWRNSSRYDQLPPRQGVPGMITVIVLGGGGTWRDRVGSGGSPVGQGGLLGDRGREGG